MVGQAGETLGIPGAQKLTEWAKEGEVAPKFSGNIAEWLYQTGEQVAPSLGPAAAGMALGLPAIPVAIAGGALFGLSQYQQTKKAAEEAGVEPGMAPTLAGAIEAGGETLGTLALERLLGPLAPTVEKGGKITVDRILRPALKTLARKFALETVPTEVGTEIGQQLGEAYVEEKAGIRKPEYLKEALGVIPPTIGLTALTGGLAHVGSKISPKIKAIENVLTRPSAPEIAPADYRLMRLGALEQVSKILEDADPKLATAFKGRGMQAIDKGEAIPLEDDISQWILGRPKSTETQPSAERPIPTKASIAQAQRDARAQKLVDEILAPAAATETSAKPLGPPTEQPLGTAVGATSYQPAFQAPIGEPVAEPTIAPAPTAAAPAAVPAPAAPEGGHLLYTPEEVPYEREDMEDQARRYGWNLRQINGAVDRKGLSDADLYTLIDFKVTNEQASITGDGKLVITDAAKKKEIENEKANRVPGMAQEVREGAPAQGAVVVGQPEKAIEPEIVEEGPKPKEETPKALTENKLEYAGDVKKEAHEVFKAMDLGKDTLGEMLRKRKINVREHIVGPDDTVTIHPTLHDATIRFTAARLPNGELIQGEVGTYDTVMLPGHVAGKKTGKLPAGTTLYILDKGPPGAWNYTNLDIYRVAPEAKPAKPAAAALPAPEGPSIVEQQTYQGKRMTSAMGPKDKMIVAKDKAGNDLGFLRYTPEEGGGFTVRKIEAAEKRKGIGTKLMEDVIAKEGPFKGATDYTEEGKKFFAKYQPAPKVETPEEFLAKTKESLVMNKTGDYHLDGYEYGRALADKGVVGNLPKKAEIEKSYGQTFTGDQWIKFQNGMKQGQRALKKGTEALADILKPEYKRPKLTEEEKIFVRQLVSEGVPFDEAVAQAKAAVEEKIPAEPKTKAEQKAWIAKAMATAKGGEALEDILGPEKAKTEEPAPTDVAQYIHEQYGLDTSKWTMKDYKDFVQKMRAAAEKQTKKSERAKTKKKQYRFPEKPKEEPTEEPTEEPKTIGLTQTIEGAEAPVRRLPDEEKVTDAVTRWKEESKALPGPNAANYVKALYDLSGVDDEEFDRRIGQAEREKEIPPEKEVSKIDETREKMDMDRATRAMARIGVTPVAWKLEETTRKNRRGEEKVGVQALFGKGVTSEELLRARQKADVLGVDMRWIRQDNTTSDEWRALVAKAKAENPASAASTIGARSEAIQWKGDRGSIVREGREIGHVLVDPASGKILDLSVEKEFEGQGIPERLTKAAEERWPTGRAAKTIAKITGPEYKAGAETPEGAAGDALRGWIDSRLSELKYAPEVKIADTSTQWPEAIAKPGQIAVYDPATQTIWVARDKITTERQLRAAVDHEAIGHYATRLLDEDYAKTFYNRMFKTIGRESLEQELRDHGYSFDLDTEEGRIRAVREKISMLAEQGVRPTGPIAQLYAWLRTQLAKVFPRMRLTDTEINRFLAKAHERVTTGAPVPPSEAMRLAEAAHKDVLDWGNRWNQAADNLIRPYEKTRVLNQAKRIIGELNQWFGPDNEHHKRVVAIAQNIQDVADMSKTEKGWDTPGIFGKLEEAAERLHMLMRQKMTMLMGDLSGEERAVFLAARDEEDAKGKVGPEYMAYEASDPATEAFFKSQKGFDKPPLLTGIKQALVKAKQSMFEHYPLLADNSLFGRVKDVLRTAEAIPERSLAWAQDQLESIIRAPGKELSPDDMYGMTKIIVLEDALKDQQLGRIDIDAQHQLGYQTAADLVSDLNRFKTTAGIDPNAPDLQPLDPQNPSPVYKAMAKRQEILDKNVNEASSLNLLPPGLRNDPRYYHHQVMHYMNLKYYGPRVSSEDLRTHKKGFQLKRQGSELPYNTEYLQSEYEFLAQLKSQIDTKKALDEVNQPDINIIDQVKQEAVNRGLNANQWHNVMDSFPEYTSWQPVPGRFFYRALGLAEKVIDQLFSGIAGDRVKANLPAGQLTIDVPQDLKDIIAMGARKQEWVIRKELAKTLDEFRNFKPENLVLQISDGILTSWKQWILMNPLRILKYNLNNMSGDLDIVLAHDPTMVFGKKGLTDNVKQSVVELYNDLKGKPLNAAQRDFMDLAKSLEVVGSGITIKEIPDINNSGIFRSLVGEKGKQGLIQRGWQTWWDNARDYTNFRENILRLTAFKYFLQKINAGENPTGASRPAELRTLIPGPNSTPAEIQNLNNRRAAKLARELIGDYGNLSEVGQWLRTHLIPFYSWMEINFPRYIRLVKNVPEGVATGAGVRRALLPVAAKGITLGMKISLLYGMVQLWNRMFFGDEDDELQRAQRGQLHLILPPGRREDGSIISLRFQGALSDALNWFGLEDFPREFLDIVSGKKSVEKALGEFAIAPAQKLFSGARPFEKAIGEALTGRTLYPEMLHPRPIRDRTEHLFKAFAMDMPYRYASHWASEAGLTRTGRPVKGELMDLASIGVYRSEAGEAAYYKTIQNIADWLKEQGYEVPIVSPTKRSNALFYWKQAVRFKDSKEADKWLREYVRLGGKEKDIKNSFKKSHPISFVPIKLRRQWAASLDAEDQQTFKIATNWWAQAYGGSRGE
jgi:ribosomal protein S18 acetylase RimI-like enzyme